MSDSQLYKQAEKRVEQKLEFYRHLGIYVFVCFILAIINFTTSPGYYWFLWPVLGWGIGVAFHGIDVFFVHENSDFKRRMIQAEMQRLQNEQNNSNHFAEKE